MEKGAYLTEAQKEGLLRAQNIHRQKIIVAQHLRAKKAVEMVIAKHVQMKKLAEKVTAHHVKMAKLAKLVIAKHVQMAQLAKKLEKMKAEGLLPQ